MGLTRLIFLALLILAAWWWLRRKPAQRNQGTRHDPADSLSMVRCQHCGVHLPRTDALQHNNQWYCDEQHANAGPGQS